MSDIEKAILLVNKAVKILEREMRQENKAGNLPTGPEPASGVRGVSFEKRTGRWCARAWVNGKTRWLGTFDTKEGAENAVKLVKSAQ